MVISYASRPRLVKPLDTPASRMSTVRVPFSLPISRGSSRFFATVDRDPSTTIDNVSCDYQGDLSEWLIDRTSRETQTYAVRFRSIIAFENMF